MFDHILTCVLPDVCCFHSYLKILQENMPLLRFYFRLGIVELQNAKILAEGKDDVTILVRHLT